MWILEIKFHLERAQKIRLLVSTPANLQVRVDGVFRFGRESGGMLPAFHRAMQNQLAELELEQGAHSLQIALAPASPEMRSAELVFGIADTANHWLPHAFEA